MDASGWPGPDVATADHCMGVAATASREPGWGVVTANLTIDCYAPAALSVTFEPGPRAQAVTFVELTSPGANGQTCARASRLWPSYRQASV